MSCMKNNMVYLESVGSWLDRSNGNIYPAFNDGKVDLKYPISIPEGEVALDWIESLSVEDSVLVNIWL